MAQIHCVLQCCEDGEEQFCVLATLWKREAKNDNTSLYRCAPIEIVSELCLILMKSEDSVIEIEQHKLWPTHFV